MLSCSFLSKFSTTSRAGYSRINLYNFILNFLSSCPFNHIPKHLALVFPFWFLLFFLNILIFLWVFPIIFLFKQFSLLISYLYFERFSFLLEHFFTYIFVLNKCLLFKLSPTDSTFNQSNLHLLILTQLWLLFRNLLYRLFFPLCFFTFNWHFFVLVNTGLVQKIYLFLCKFILLDRSIHFNTITRQFLFNLPNRLWSCKFTSLFCSDCIIVYLWILYFIVGLLNFTFLARLAILIWLIKLSLSSGLISHILSYWSLFQLIITGLNLPNWLMVNLINILIPSYLSFDRLINNLARSDQIVLMFLVIFLYLFFFNFLQKVMIQRVHIVYININSNKN